MDLVLVGCTVDVWEVLVLRMRTGGPYLLLLCCLLALHSAAHGECVCVCAYVRVWELVVSPSWCGCVCVCERLLRVPQTKRRSTLLRLPVGCSSPKATGGGIGVRAQPGHTGLGHAWSDGRTILGSDRAPSVRSCVRTDLSKVCSRFILTTLPGCLSWHAPYDSDSVDRKFQHFVAFPLSVS